ncbi:MAG TPA: hypothetical protein VFA48_11510 [Gammaproteobacteria bacterium]|nr:hypothetical protein [Gammaproteobacteria bacterium]
MADWIEGDELVSLLDAERRDKQERVLRENGFQRHRHYIVSGTGKVKLFRSALDPSEPLAKPAPDVDLDAVRQVR